MKLQSLTMYVFLPLTVMLILVCFHEPLRIWIQRRGGERLDRLEAKLGSLERFYWLGFAVCLGVGVLVRSVSLCEIPYGVNQDGMMAGVEALCLANNGTDQFGMSWPTYFQAWGFAQMSTLYSCLMIPFVKIMGLSKLTLRLPMLLVSMSMLVVLWDFARRMLGKGFALLTLFVAALNPWHIMQSRWALEANLLPHVMLLGCWLLYIGRERRIALYASMIVMALAPYAYGLGCFSAPFLLICMAVFYIGRKKANIMDLIVCVGLFLAVAGPYFYTMAINAFGWETVQLGKITLPYFELSQRSNEIALVSANPYTDMLKNFPRHLHTYLTLGAAAEYNIIPWAHTVYRFMPPVILLGLYKLWRERRKLVLNREDSPARDGMMLTLLWFLAAVFSGLCVGGVVNRNNAVYYPVILAGAYGLYCMGRKSRSVLVIMLCAIAVSFTGFCHTYFFDEEYKEQTGRTFRAGLVDALLDIRDWDYDEIYITSNGSITHNYIAEAAAMFAHGIDYAARSEETELTDINGEPSGWYFTERYHVFNPQEHEIDPMACSVYIITQDQKAYFSEEDFELTNYKNYAVAYPRYWLE